MSNEGMHNAEHELIPKDILRRYGFKEGKELELNVHDRERKIGLLKAALANLNRMEAADPNAPADQIERKSHSEQLNMAQDNFVIGLRTELLILSNPELNLVEDPAELRRVLYYKKLIETMIKKKDSIVKEGKEKKLSKNEIFQQKRKQRIEDIETLKMMIPVVSEFIKRAALQLGTNLDEEDTRYFTKL